MQSNFQRIYPGLQLAYYGLVLVLVFLVKHPLELAILWIAVVASMIYMNKLFGTNDFKQDVKLYAFPLLFALLAGIVNALFRHYGMNPIFALPNGNQVTWDAFIDGGLGGFRFGLSLLWLKHMYDCMDTNRVLYLFKPLFPTFSLLLTLVLRFFPHFLEQSGELVTVNKLKIRDRKLGFKDRWQNRADVLAKLSSWGLESSIVTGEMMQARGHGLVKKKTQYTLYKWTPRDSIIMLVVLVLGIVYFYLRSLGVLEFISYPFIYTVAWSSLNYINLAALSIIAFVPLLTDLRRY